jgi:hypothetical protein
MAKSQKILEEARRRPHDVRMNDAVKLAEAYGFVFRAGGKHSMIGKRKGYPSLLSFQTSGDGKVKEYQIKQLLDAIDELDAPPDDV